MISGYEVVLCGDHLLEARNYRKSIPRGALCEFGTLFKMKFQPQEKKTLRQVHCHCQRTICAVFQEAPIFLPLESQSQTEHNLWREDGFSADDKLPFRRRRWGKYESLTSSNPSSCQRFSKLLALTIHDLLTIRDNGCGKERAIV